MTDLSAAHRDVLVLVGTQTGNSERVAAAVAERLVELGFTCHVSDMADVPPEALAGYRQAVAVLCTWAEGAYPDNARDFAAALDAVAPDLGGLTFGIAGLGDRAYEPFYQVAAVRLAVAFAELGARPALEPLEVDGPVTPTILARAREWADELAAAWGSPAS